MSDLEQLLKDWHVERIVECVEACVGVENPKALVSSSKEMLEILERWQEISPDCLFKKGLPLDRDKNECIHCATQSAIAKAKGEKCS